MAKNPTEIATLTVNGQKFEDWTTVHVEQRHLEWYPIFSFDCTEQTPAPSVRANLQIKPGDAVSVSLAGMPVLFGYVTERHVGYDAKNHGVRIVGKGKTFDLTNTSVFSKGGSYDNKSWSQLAQALISDAGITMKTKGQLDEKPFENCHVLPGEIVSQCLERYARMRAILIGSTPFGEMLAIGDHETTLAGTLVEGKNIKSANCLISDEKVYKKIYAIGQRPSNDETNGDASNKQIAMVDGTSTRNRILVTLADIGDTDHGVKQRAEMEKLFTEGAAVEAHITVQGWLKPGGGGLWQAGEYYRVTSPMLMLDQTLGCKVCTFEQSSGTGTTTTLQMVLPVQLKGRPDMRGSNPG